MKWIALIIHYALQIIHVQATVVVKLMEISKIATMMGVIGLVVMVVLVRFHFQDVLIIIMTRVVAQLLAVHQYISVLIIGILVLALIIVLGLMIIIAVMLLLLDVLDIILLIALAMEAVLE
jgi:hypothetical protein